MRRMRGRWWFAAVRPQGKREGTWALPKGLVDAGEAPAETALREGFEETGVEGRLGAKLGDVRYVYTWDGERVFKVVSFFLAHARARSHRRHFRPEWRSRSPRRAGFRSTDGADAARLQGRARHGREGRRGALASDPL